METPHRVPQTSLQKTLAGSLRESLVDAGRFWEPRRILYNLMLGAFAAAWLVLTWPHFRPALALFPLFQFAVLGLLANVCYSAAYFADFPLQHAVLRGALKKWRWWLWVIGMLLAILMENYWIADEIYPFV